MIAKEIKSKSGRERARKKPKVAFENNWNCWFKNGFYVSVVIHARKSLFFPKRVYNHRSVRSFFVSQFFVLKQWWVSKIKQYLTKKKPFILLSCCYVSSEHRLLRSFARESFFTQTRSFFKIKTKPDGKIKENSWY